MLLVPDENVGKFKISQIKAGNIHTKLSLKKRMKTLKYAKTLTETKCMQKKYLG